MQRLLLLAFLLSPSLAMAQVKGIKLVHVDPTVLTFRQNTGQLVVGKDVAVTFPSMMVNGGVPHLFHFDGTPIVSLPFFSVNSAVFAGDHLYLATGAYGLNIVETKDWQTVHNMGGRGMNEIHRIAATPDGGTVFTMNCFPKPKLVIYDRDPKTGKLANTQVFQPDEAGVAEITKDLPPGENFTVEKAATRVPNFVSITNMAVSADGKFLFVTNHAVCVLVFGKDSKGWRLVDTVRDNIRGRHRYGLRLPKNVLPVGERVFVGGKKRLSEFTFDGEKLSFTKFWVDDSEPPGHEYETVPYLDDVQSLAASANGKFLFIAGGDDGGVTVCKIGDDLQLVGKVNDSPDGTLMLEVATAGNKLFAKTTNCQLLIYDLDATFTK